MPEEQKVLEETPQVKSSRPILKYLIGFFILTSNWVLIGIPFVILILFYMSKIPREEKELIDNFGKEYLRYKITNLWKYDLPKGWRLIYSIGREGVEILSIILEWMNHKNYERRFNY